MTTVPATPAQVASTTTSIAAPPSAASAEQAAALSPQAYDDILKTTVDAALKKTRAEAAWTDVTVKRGQTLSTIFAAQNLPSTTWVDVLALGKPTQSLHQLNVGDKLRLRVVNGSLEALNYPIDDTRTLEVRRVNDQLQAHVQVADLEHKPAEATGVIRNSLFVDGQRAGLSDGQIMQFAHIFNYDIDFAQDLHPGDRFTVVYDQVFKNGHKLRNGDILAAEFINQGHVYRAVRFAGKDGDVGYYTPSGESLKRAFIRTPVDFTRISSGFTLARWHPILHRMRAHYGVDYAAPTGTPVHVTGDGRIAFIGRDGGYGNCIKVKHGSHYETIYGHMSRFHKHLSVGTKVHQGQVIGYVGMTGLATGPHLHYEFRVDGVPKNPITVKLPHGLPLAPRELKQFRHESQPLIAQIDSLDSRQYADNGPTIGTH